MITSTELLTECERLSSCTRSAATIRTYGYDWRAFQVWCGLAGREALPAIPETVVLYLTNVMRHRKVATAARSAAAISYYHRERGLDLPAGRIKRLLEGAQRLRLEQPLPKRPITIDQLREICAKSWQSSDRKGVRNHAILTLGFSSSLRRSNLVGLELADVRFVEQGLVVTVRKEKQDQLGKGRLIGIVRGERPETCAVRATAEWIRLRGFDPGPLFVPVRGAHSRLNSQIVADIVKTAIRSIGLNPKEYAGHSLRSGFVTQAVLSGVTELVIARQTGHRSLDSLRRYFRPNDLFRANASAMIGL